MDYTIETTAVSSSPELGAGMTLIVFVLAVAVYIYTAYCLYVLGKKTNTPNEWMAWIPIVNMFYMLQIAQLSLLWFVGLIIPFLNIIVIIYVWWKIAERRGRPGWWGILMLISPVNLILLWLLAFRDAVTSPVENNSQIPTV